MEALENLPEGNPLKDDSAYQAVAKRRYVRVPRIVSITRPEEVSGFGRQRFFARDNRTAWERRLQADRAGTASVGDRGLGSVWNLAAEERRLEARAERLEAKFRMKCAKDKCFSITHVQSNRTCNS